MVSNSIKGPMFLLLTGSGIVGNIFVSVNYMCIFFGDTKKKSIHVTLIHLAFTNIPIFFSKLMLKTIQTFGLIPFPDDRGLSISISSFLTVVQAATISPRAPPRPCTIFKPASTWRILPLFLFFWILSSLVSVNLLYYIRNINSLNRSRTGASDGSCFLPASQTMKWIFLILMALRDFLFLSLMGWATVYMVHVLHKHHKHAHYLRRSKVFYQNPPEVRAVHSVLLLMLCFLFFSWTDSIISLYLNSFLENNFIKLSVLEIISLSYSFLSPFVLTHRDGHLAKCWHIH
ncbi:vomeronasal type-1 receptor 46-like [Lycaon pictus]